MTLPHEAEVLPDDGSRDEPLDRFESRVVDQRTRRQIWPHWLTNWAFSPMRLPLLPNTPRGAASIGRQRHTLSSV